MKEIFIVKATVGDYVKQLLKLDQKSGLYARTEDGEEFRVDGIKIKKDVNNNYNISYHKLEFKCKVKLS